MAKTKTMKAVDDLGRERLMEIDLGSGAVISSKLLRKKSTKKSKEINIFDMSPVMNKSGKKPKVDDILGMGV